MKQDEEEPRQQQALIQLTFCRRLSALAADCARNGGGGLVRRSSGRSVAPASVQRQQLGEEQQDVTARGLVFSHRATVQLLTMEPGKVHPNLKTLLLTTMMFKWGEWRVRGGQFEVVLVPGVERCEDLMEIPL